MRGCGVDPADALQFLHKKGFLLFNCWHFPKGAGNPEKPCLEEINPEDIDSLWQFFKRLVEQHRHEQTDILAISRNVPNYELLLAKIRQLIRHK
jgi:cupin superfamily acireductone dioxygenase involved in methionine salvage